MRWPNEVTQWLRENVPGRSTKEVVELINKQGFDEKYNMIFTDGMITSAKSRYKINSGTPKGNPKGSPSEQFPEEIKNYIYQNYKGVGPKEMAERLNKIYGTNYVRTRLKAYYANHGLNSGVDTRWKIGQTPPNKGKKMSQAQYDKCKATMFKKGQIPPNKMQVGERTHTTEGYLIEKVKNEGLQRERFVFVHRTVWEKHHGAIPKGKKIIFLDGNKDNCDISNLEMVDNEENLELNHRKLRFKHAESTKAGIAVARARIAAKRRKKNDVSKDQKNREN